MKKLLLFATVGLLTACNTTTQPLEPAEDYALVTFGETGVALENTLGVQDPTHPMDGRTGNVKLPDSLKLSLTQIAQIKTLRDSFALEHTVELAQLKVIYAQARTARRAGETRDAIRLILLRARPIVENLKDDVRELHLAIRAVFTPQQRAWLDKNRPRITCMACGICPGSGC